VGFPDFSKGNVNNGMSGDVGNLTIENIVVVHSFESIKESQENKT
jgi:hypothetical protein